MGKLTVVWISIVVGCVAAAALAGPLKALNLANVSPATVGSSLTALLFVALLIERAVEVFMSPITADDKQNLIGEQNRVRTALGDLRARLNPAPSIANPNPPAPTAAEALELQKAIEGYDVMDRRLTAQINALDKTTQKVALSFSVPISFVVALSGVRAFAPLVGATTEAGVATTAALNSTQLAVFSAADVLLTAGLLAGGADGIHKILDRFIKLAAGRDVQQPASNS